ncbi:cytochrome P450 [Ephemerocybe angulata]|uniref:Cytochrome P450 n=1 Tax=Ephemerocybe angulata TaxID=980116 RepID=A0A8H6HZB4_9AGAR|nr:cytochrome P450 [Tulosesus angulatus]
MLDILQSPLVVGGLVILAPFILKRLVEKVKRYPIIGNLLEIGKKETPWINYSELSKEYGDMVYLEALGIKILVLHSLDKAVELLEKKSGNYSGRPVMPMIFEHLRFNEYFSNADYTPTWRRQRRIFHQHFHPGVVSRYHPIHSHEVIRYVQDLAATPLDFKHHIQQLVLSPVFLHFMGLRSRTETTHISKQVDIIPALKYLPRWLPGMGWKDFAEYYRNLGLWAKQAPYDHALKMMRDGNAEESVATRLINELPLARRSSKGGAGARHTSFATAMTFTILMALHPEVQKKAQEEIDSVVGVGQIPGFEDRDKLVYIDAIIREVFRWHCEVPLGLPHKASEDDVFEGYFIPKGTIIAANLWHIMKDPANYDNPTEFIPERHIKDGQINKDVLDPYDAVFGYGRRICVGRYLSLDALYLIVSTTLAMFDISPPKDKKLECKFNDGAILAPEPYEVIITPRSARHEEAIRNLVY